MDMRVLEAKKPATRTAKETKHGHTHDRGAGNSNPPCCRSRKIWPLWISLLLLLTYIILLLSGSSPVSSTEDITLKSPTTSHQFADKKTQYGNKDNNTLSKRLHLSQDTKENSEIDRASPRKNSTRTTKGDLAVSGSHYGFSNQQICLEIAANFAVQYNRTLVVPSNGYSSSIHQERQIAFGNLFETNECSLDFRPFKPVDNKRCAKQITFHPKNTSGASAAKDPFPNAPCIKFACRFGVVRLATPPSLFPHADQVHFPYHHTYQNLARDVVNDIRQSVHGKHLLALHVRRGDRVIAGKRATWPLFDCSAVSNLYPYRVKAESSVFCTSNTSSTLEKVSNGLSWERFFEHLATSSSAQEQSLFSFGAFDAMFVASDDPDWVRTQVELYHDQLPPTFFIDDFPFVKEKLNVQNDCNDAVEVLVVEELVLAKSDVYVPSFPSSITEHILRLRLARTNRTRDQELYKTYVEHKLVQFGASALDRGN